MTNRLNSKINKWVCIILIAAFITAISPTEVQAGYTVPVTEYSYSVPALASSPFMITNGPDGNMWFTSYTQFGYVNKITPAGVITSYSVAPGAYDIAEGPDELGDHYMWWTGTTYDDTVSKLNIRTGVITQYDVANLSNPKGITKGPDEAMWFTYKDLSKIGRITTEGILTHYNVPTATSGIADITLGPDGNLWFTESFKCAIGKITPDGTVTRYALPTASFGDGCDPYMITTGPDDNLWFTLLNSVGVGKITPAGVATFIPTGGSRPIAITSGPDGNLWITEGMTNTIGRLTTEGILTLYDVPTASSGLWGIGTGSDGNIWFVESDTNKIGKLVPQYAYPSVGQNSLSSRMYPGPTDFSITFNQDVTNPVGNTAPEDATNPENYLLVNLGGNGYLDTVSCAGGLVSDDVGINIDSVSYDSQTHTATVSINGGTPLPNNSYALFICGTTSITNLVGNPLGDGSDYLYRFLVGPLAAVLPDTGFTPGKTTVLPLQPAAKKYSMLGDLWLEIPHLNVKLPIIGVPATMEGWDITWLGNQAGWLEGTAFPTWAGNSVITGHVWNADNTPGIFLNLEKLVWGDKIIVHAWDQEYMYEVRSIRKQVKPDDSNFTLSHEEYPWITLLTCSEFNENSESYRYRTVLKAVQISVN